MVEKVVVVVKVVNVLDVIPILDVMMKVLYLKGLYVSVKKG